MSGDVTVGKEIVQGTGATRASEGTGYLSGQLSMAVQGVRIGKWSGEGILVSDKAASESCHLSEVYDLGQPLRVSLSSSSK